MRKFIFTTGRLFYPNLIFNRGDNYELFFHQRHGVLDDATQLLTKEEINYIEDTVRKLDIKNKAAIFVEAEDGSVSLAVAYLDVWNRSQPTYQGRLQRTNLTEDYNITVSTVWRNYAYFQIDAPFRYGEKTKAFHNLRNYLSNHESTVVAKFGRTNNTTAHILTPSYVPRLFEREILYKTKDLRPWLDYIGLCSMNDFDEPISEMNEENFKQLLPYVNKYLKEHHIGYDSKKITSKSKKTRGLAYGEYLFNIQNGDLVLEKIKFKKSKGVYELFGNSRHHNPVIQASFLELLNQQRTPYKIKTFSDYLLDKKSHRYELHRLLGKYSPTFVTSHHQYNDLLSNVELTSKPTTSPLTALIEEYFTFFRIFHLEYVNPENESEIGLAIVFKLKGSNRYGLKVHSLKENQSFMSDNDTVETTIVQFITKLYRDESYVDSIGFNFNKSLEDDDLFTKEDGDNYLHIMLRRYNFIHAYYSESGD